MCDAAGGPLNTASIMGPNMIQSVVGCNLLDWAVGTAQGPAVLLLRALTAFLRAWTGVLCPQKN